MRKKHAAQPTPRYRIRDLRATFRYFGGPRSQEAAMSARTIRSRLAAPGEVDNAAIAFVRSLRQRYSDGFAILAELTGKPEPPRQPSSEVANVYGAVKMTFGKYRDRWLLPEVKRASSGREPIDQPGPGPIRPGSTTKGSSSDHHHLFVRSRFWRARIARDKKGRALAQAFP